MSLSSLKRLLADHGIRPLKARGQHFLFDDRVVAKTVAAAGISSGDRVVEIGSGPGILTSALLDAGAHVTAVELDRRLADVIEGRFAGRTLTVIREDARTVPNALLAESGDYRVVANLPYGITTDILRKFLLDGPRPSSVTVMVQREVADRILARPPAMSALAVMVQLLGTARKVMDVAASSFYPPPKVRSAVIHIAVHDPATLGRELGGMDPEDVLRVSRLAFTGRRKQLKNTLKTSYGEERVISALDKAGLAPSVRPEEVALDQWISLAASLRG